MTMVTLSEVEFEFDFDPYVVANQLCGGVPPVEEMEACRSLCDAIGREFADAAFQRVKIPYGVNPLSSRDFNMLRRS